MATNPRPNILWICTDSQRWDTLGCFGNRLVSTPCIDTLAATGTACSRAYAQSPVCTPSRGSFLTGRYPAANRLQRNGQECPPDLHLAPRSLRDAGYVTGLVGKLHLAACDRRLELGREWWREDKRRFFVGSEPRIDDGYHEFHWDHAPAHPSPASAYRAFLAEHGLPDGNGTVRNDCHHVRDMPGDGLDQTSWCFATAANFVRRHGSSIHPWMLSLNCFAPHYDFAAPRERIDAWRQRLADIPLPAPTPEQLAGQPAFQRTIREQSKHYPFATMTADEHRMIRAAYWASCEHIDAQLGKLIDTLRATGQLERTIIVFHSDHGELLGDNGHYTKGPFMPDGAVRVPLVLHGPGIPSGIRHDAPVELTDVAPTLLALAGVHPIPGQQGRSLMPELTGAGPARTDAFCEYADAIHTTGEPHRGSMLTDGRWKLIRWHGVGGELYDLADDPMERSNRWDDPTCASERLRLIERLSDRLDAASDQQFPRVGVF